MQLADAGNQDKWYQMFLKELKYNINVPVPILENNKGTVDLSLNPMTKRKSKHIPLKFHVICDYIENEDIDIIQTSSEEVLANSLTKPYARIKLKHFASGLSLV